MHIDHICIAVRSIDKSIENICKLLGYTIKTKKVTNYIQDVNVQFIKKIDSIDIKLIEPASKNSNLINFLKTKGEGLHHICLLTQDVNDTASTLVENGARLITKPQLGEAFNDNLIAFLYLGNGLNVELIDTIERRDLIS